MAANQSARCVSVTEAAHFSPDARINEELLATAGLVVRMNCYEPGQATPTHMHPGEDEILYIVEGNGHVAVEGRADLPVRAGDLVCLPAERRGLGQVQRRARRGVRPSRLRDARREPVSGRRRRGGLSASQRRR